MEKKEEELQRLIDRHISIMRDRISVAADEEKSELEKKMQILLDCQSFFLLESGLQDRSSHDKNEVSTESQKVPRVFPDEFSLLRCDPRPFDSEPILLEESVEDALGQVETGIHLHTTDTLRVGPLCIVSTARSGKTTLLKHLYNKLLQNGNFHPILADFNGDGKFKLRDGESDCDGFLRWVATSLLYDYEEDVPASFTCQEQELKEYLSKSKKPVVLLVDELNALTGYEVSEDLSELLRKTFLDDSGIYLCFTSHWTLDIQEIIGKSESPRVPAFVQVPRTQNEEDIDAVMQMMAQPLTRVQLAACLGSVGLLVSTYGKRTGKLSFNPEMYFDSRVKSNWKYPVESFLNEFCYGSAKPDDKDLRCFDMFTTRTSKGKIQWPMCFAKEFLHNAQELALHRLINHAENAVSLAQTGTGLEWEYIARVAIGVIARCAEFRNLSKDEAQVHEHILAHMHTHDYDTCTCACTHMRTCTHIYTQVIGMPLKKIGCRPKVIMMRLPSYIKEPREARTEIDVFL